MPLHRSLLSTSLAAAALLLSAKADAALFCVSTGDQLASALSTAQSNNQDDEIRITVGTRTRPNLATGFTRWTYTPGSNDADNDLSVSGGWTDAGCTSKTPGIGTILDGELEGEVMDFSLPINFLGNLVISDLRLVRGRTTLFAGVSVLRINVEGGSGTLLVDRVVARDSGATGDNGSAVRITMNGGNATLRSLVVTNNSTFSGAALIASAGVGSTVNINNASVYANNDTQANAAGPVGGMSIFGAGTVTINNSLLFANTSSNASDLQMQANFGALANNHIGNLRGTPASNASMSTGNPQIVMVDGLPVPQATSPLRDTGLGFIPGGSSAQDVRGLPRVQGVRIDRGAVEFDELHADGFE